MSDIKHVKDGDHRGAFVIEKDGKRIAEMTYSKAGEHRAMIDHTWTADELRGKGVGRQLLDAAVAWARADKLLIVPVCPYAKSQFDKDASIGDVLAK